jgi:hypothetical protein
MAGSDRWFERMANSQDGDEIAPQNNCGSLLLCFDVFRDLSFACNESRNRCTKRNILVSVRRGES